MLIPQTLRRMVEIPYVMRVFDTIGGSRSIYGPFWLLREAIAFSERPAQTRIFRQVARVDLPVFVRTGHDWANWRWVPRPGVRPPDVPWPGDGAAVWVADTDSERLGEIVYGPFADAEAATHFCETLHSVLIHGARGRVHPLLSPEQWPEGGLGRTELEEF